MKKEKAQLLQRQQSMKSTRKKKRVGKILHLKGLKRKIPNKWRVNWPAHISFIRHAFKIQLVQTVSLLCIMESVPELVEGAEKIRLATRE